MYKEVLTERAQELFPRLQRFTSFYLAGGTALALQIGHRRSVDFDLFTDEALPRRMLEKIKRIFSDAAVAVTYSAPEQLDVTIDGIKTTFLVYPYPAIKPLVTVQEVAMLSVREIAATKAFSVGKRLAYKDYVDWYFLLSGNHVSLAEALELAGHKYGPDFNDRLFLGQLLSLEDVAEQPIDFISEPVNRQTIDSFLKETVKTFSL